MKLSFQDKLGGSTPAARLTFLAGISALIYLIVFTLPFPLARLYNTIPPVDYAKLTHYSPAGFLAYMLGLGALFGLYIAAIRLAIPQAGLTPLFASRSVSPYIFMTGAVLAVILILSYPVSAIDLFIYAIRTRGWALYGLNPLATAPEMLPVADPWLGLAAEWMDAPSPYGPLWEWLSLAAFYGSGGDFPGHLFALKVLAALAYLGCGWLVYVILRQLRPEWAIAGTVAYTLSPLALLESVQNGHNDIVMTFFLLLAVRELVRRAVPGEADHHKTILQELLICLWLALSILVKFITAMVVPFFLLSIAARRSDWKGRLAVLLGYSMVVALLVVGPMWQFWPGWNNWAISQAGSGAGRSLLALLILCLKDILGVNTAFDLSRNVVHGVFGLIYLFFLWRTLTHLRQEKNAYLSATGDSPVAPLTIAPAFFVLFWYVLLAAPVFHAWYLLWFLPLAALLLPYQRPLATTIVFSITALFIIPYFETIRVWYPTLLDNQLLGHLVGVPLLIGPPAIAAMWPIRPGTRSEV
jgi:hypothetical protein